jgi:hypothetical protein
MKIVIALMYELARSTADMNGMVAQRTRRGFLRRILRQRIGREWLDQRDPELSCHELAVEPQGAATNRMPLSRCHRHCA